jgi:nucleoside-diphosphate-sugar epimerase
MAPGPEAEAVASLEDAVLAVEGVVLRYGMFYGPGTYFDAPAGVVTIVDV